MVSTTDISLTQYFRAVTSTWNTVACILWLKILVLPHTLYLLVPTPLLVFESSLYPNVSASGCPFIHFSEWFTMATILSLFLTRHFYFNMSTWHLQTLENYLTDKLNIRSQSIHKVGFQRKKHYIQIVLSFQLTFKFCSWILLNSFWKTYFFLIDNNWIVRSICNSALLYSMKAKLII